MHLWSQLISLLLASLAFGITAATRPRRMVLQTLGRTPLVWLTLALFIYIAIQGSNHVWAYRQSSSAWWLERAEGFRWLPSGIDSPFQQMNAWRRLLTWLPAALVASTVWIGDLRRRSVQLLVTILFLNATAVAAYAIAQQLSGTTKIFGAFEFPQAAGPFGSFVYKNHAAAFLLVGFCAGCSLALHCYLRGVARSAPSTPAAVFILLAAITAFAIVFSLSRLGTAISAAAAFLLLVGGIASIRRTGARTWKAVSATTVVFLVLGGSVSMGDTERIRREFERLSRGVADESASIRFLSYGSTATMFRDHWIFGVGAGGYRYLAPVYFADYPAVLQSTHFGPRFHYTKRYAMNEAHSDIAQFAAELGTVGGGVALLLVAGVLATLTVRRRISHPVGLGAWVALVAIVAFAAFDFPLQNPALLGTLAFFAAAAARWADLETAKES